MNGRVAARSGEWAQHFSNACCLDYTEAGELLFQVMQATDRRSTSFSADTFLYGFFKGW